MTRDRDREDLDEAHARNKASEERANKAVEEMTRLGDVADESRLADDARRGADDARRSADDDRRGADDQRRAADDARRGYEPVNLTKGTE